VASAPLDELAVERGQCDDAEVVPVARRRHLVADGHGAPRLLGDPRDALEREIRLFMDMVREIHTDAATNPSSRDGVHPARPVCGDVRQMA